MVLRLATIIGVGNWKDWKLAAERRFRSSFGNFCFLVEKKCNGFSVVLGITQFYWEGFGAKLNVSAKDCRESKSFWNGDWDAGEEGVNHLQFGTFGSRGGILKVGKIGSVNGWNSQKCEKKSASISSQIYVTCVFALTSTFWNISWQVTPKRGQELKTSDRTTIHCQHIGAGEMLYYLWKYMVSWIPWVRLLLRCIFFG